MVREFWCVVACYLLLWMYPKFVTMGKGGRVEAAAVDILCLMCV
jgi:hypothetical protein